MLKSACDDNQRISIYSLPGDNLVVPSLLDKTHENPLPVLHLSKKVCALNACKEKRSKLHTLMKKEAPLCLHTLLANCLEGYENQEMQRPVKTIPTPKIDRNATVTFVLKKIKENFPSLSDQRCSEFLALSRQHITDIVHSDDISNEISKYLPSKCDFCFDTDLNSWPHRSTKACHSNVY